MRALFVGDRPAGRRWGLWLLCLVVLAGVAGGLLWPEHLRPWWPRVPSAVPGPVVVPVAEPTQAAAPLAAPATAQASEPAPEVPAEPPLEEQVQAFVGQWARHWSEKNTQAYLDAYAPHFQPEGGKSLAVWAQERKARILSKKKISVQVKSLGIVSVSEVGVTVSFTQVYEADQLVSTTPKVLVLGKRDGQWGILREFTP